MFAAKLRRIVCAAMTPLALTFADSAAAEPALWKVQSPQATIYLFGTVHVLKPEVVWRTPKIDAAIRASEALMLDFAPITREPDTLTSDRSLSLAPASQPAKMRRWESPFRSFG